MNPDYVSQKNKQPLFDRGGKEIVVRKGDGFLFPVHDRIHYIGSVDGPNLAFFG